MVKHFFLFFQKSKMTDEDRPKDTELLKPSFSFLKPKQSKTIMFAYKIIWNCMQNQVSLYKYYYDVVDRAGQQTQA